MARRALCSRSAVMASWIAPMRAMRRLAVVSHSPTLHTLWGLLAGPWELWLHLNLLSLGVPTEGEESREVRFNSDGACQASSSLTVKPWCTFPMICIPVEVHAAIAPTGPHAAGGANPALLCRVHGILHPVVSSIENEA